MNLILSLKEFSMKLITGRILLRTFLMHGMKTSLLNFLKLKMKSLIWLTMISGIQMERMIGHRNGGLIRIIMDSHLLKVLNITDIKEKMQFAYSITLQLLNN